MGSNKRVRFRVPLPENDPTVFRSYNFVSDLVRLHVIRAQANAGGGNAGDHGSIRNATSV